MKGTLSEIRNNEIPHKVKSLHAEIDNKKLRCDYPFDFYAVTAMDDTAKEGLGNPSKDRQRSVDAIVLISASVWPKRLSNFKNLVETSFEFGFRMSNDATFCQTNFKNVSPRFLARPGT